MGIDEMADKDVHEALTEMLMWALLAEGRTSGFTFDKTAAEFLANRALGNIEVGGPSEKDTVIIAKRAILSLPEFINRIERETSTKTFLSRESAIDLIGELTRDDTLECVYPWCSEISPD
jgi:hypothetical protein